MNADIAQHKFAIDEICRRYHVRRLELFGSATTERFRPGESDFDFLVEFESMPNGGYFDAYFGVVEDLADVLGRPVDLVVGSAIKNPYFRQSVDASRVLVYAA